MKQMDGEVKQNVLGRCPEGKMQYTPIDMVILKLLQPKNTNIYAIVKNDVFVAKICKYALYESSEGLFCAPRKPANFCHPGKGNCLQANENQDFIKKIKAPQENENLRLCKTLET